MSSATAPSSSIDRFSLPDASGRFGRYGGVFVPETLMTALEELGAAYEVARKDPAFQSELRAHLKEFAGRPTEL
jgi:tryptophan synthase beta chain